MRMKTNILIVHNYYRVPGGEDTVVQNEKALLEKHGHKVILYTRSNEEISGLSKKAKCMLPITSIFNRKVYKDIRDIIVQNKIDIVHVHNTLTIISPSVYYAAFASRVPVVQTVHNFRLLCPGALFFCKGRVCEECCDKSLFAALRKKCYRNSFAQTLMCVAILNIHRKMGTYRKINYICLTEFNKKKLLRLNEKRNNIAPRKIYVKPNFCESSEKIVPYENRKNRFVYVGRLDKSKGLDILLKAWEEIDEYELLIYGTGPMEDECRIFIESNKNMNVRLMGFVENKEVKEVIAKAKALILPTQWYEGFPMTIVEAFSVGTPVIGSDIGNVGELIKDKVNGLHFKYNSSESIILAVRELTDMVNSTYKCYLNHYTPKSNYETLMEIYNSILEEKE